MIRLLLRALFLGAALAAVGVAQGHPGVGIVEDASGNIFYTDLKQVWKITPSGEKTVAVPGVHTHELCLDGDGNLYGEHLWYEGDATKKWGHRLWRLHKDGTLSDVFPAREGFLNDYSFVRDGNGNMYWVDFHDRKRINKRTPDGKIATHATAEFRDPRWMTARPDGTLLLIDRGDLVRVTHEGKVATIAAKLSEHKPPPSRVSDRHYHMGLWTDAKGSVYVAVAGEKLVLRVEANGSTSVAGRSPDGWAPSGGMFSKDGALWLLEYDRSNAVRARRITSSSTAADNR